MIGGMDMLLVGAFLLTCAAVGWHLGPKVLSQLQEKPSKRNRWS